MEAKKEVKTVITMELGKLDAQWLLDKLSELKAKNGTMDQQVRDIFIGELRTVLED